MPVNDNYIEVKVKVTLDWFHDVEAGLGIEMSDLTDDVLSELLSYLAGYGANKTDNLLDVIADKLQEGTVFIKNHKIDYDEFDEDNFYVVNRLTEDNTYELVGSFDTVYKAIIAIGENSK